ncbi:MAG: response regulator transcription factor [Acidobacteria bacterium]|nr:response regulator transcription factor [Acidobacteriota bacterium]
MPGQARLTVAVIEDIAEIREGLAAMISSGTGLACAGAFASVEEALEALARLAPDVVLTDLGLPGMGGIEGIARIRERLPAATIVVLTVYDDDRKIFDAMCAGASGYLLKKTPPAQLLAAIREAAEGGAPMSPPVARRVIELFREIRPRGPDDHDLSPAELRLLKLLAEGHHYKTAAGKMAISTSTVSYHLQQIYRKLHVHSKSEAVAKALRAGWIR